MKNNVSYFDFSVPDVPAPHHVIVEERANNVLFIEDFGAGSGMILHRAMLPLSVWKMIREDVRKYLNARAKAKGVKACKGWRSGGRTGVDRILGRELIVLIWSLAGADEQGVKAAFRRWSTHRPEDLWYLFQQADVDGRTWDAPLVGWRAALPLIMQHDKTAPRLAAA